MQWYNLDIILDTYGININGTWVALIIANSFSTACKDILS